MFYIGIDKKTLEIRVAEFTPSDVGDAPMLPAASAILVRRGT